MEGQVWESGGDRGFLRWWPSSGILFEVMNHLTQICEKI